MGTRVTERDVRLLRWIGEQRGAPFEVVRWLLGRWGRGGRVAVRTGRDWVSRMERLGLVEHRSLLGVPWVELTRAGARSVGCRWNRDGIALATADHQASVAVVRWLLEETSVAGGWLPEGSFQARDLAGSQQRRPDGAWLVDDALTAVEVELHRKATFRDAYRDIMERMPAEVDAVLWFTPPEHVEWLGRRLAGCRLPYQVRRLPTLDPATHSAGCRCGACRVAGVVSTEEMRQVWEPLAASVPEALGGLAAPGVRSEWHAQSAGAFTAGGAG